MNIKRAAFSAVIVIAVAALAVPLVGLSTHASGVGGSVRPAVAPVAEPAPAPTAAVRGQQSMKLANGQEVTVEDRGQDAQAGGKVSAETLSTLGIPRTADPAAAAKKIQKRLLKGGASGEVSIQSGEPEILAGNAAFSAALMTNVGGRDNQFSEVTLIADWDGREDCAADRSKKVDDFSLNEPDIDFVLTRTAISEHTIANGFAENIFYYGDSVGNVWVGADTTGDGRVDLITQINIPTTLNAFGTVNSDDQITITGLAVNPVADLGSFGNVNGAYIPNFGGGAPGKTGVIGEILYVTYTDTESGLRLTANNTPVRSGLLAFPVSDAISPAKAEPGNVTDTGFPVTVGAAFGVAFSTFSNIAGCAVDDDGSVYFQQVDLIQFTGANIVKVASKDDVAWQDRSLATSGFGTFTTLNPTNGLYPDASGPNGGGVSQINRFTNYSGTSTLFGNIAAINTGPCNVLYAAVSRSFVATDSFEDRLTEGLFPAPSAFTAGTPSMVISFADCSGAFDICSGNAGGSIKTNVGGILPAANGIADAAVAGQAVTPGVNNFRLFVLGNGPDIRPATGGTSVVPGTPASLLKLDMQIDYQIHAGIAVNEEGTVFVISGGAPGGPGKNPSPMVGEILCFPDRCPADRRADFIDLRGNTLPNPPASGGNVGDGDSDRFDHIFYQSPIDAVTLTPGGLSGLSTGFLRYTNRLAPNPIGTALNVTLGQTGGQQVLGDDATSGQIIFELLDPSHQVAGGDDQNPPFRGDDDNGAGTPTVAGPLSGGFEFLFGGPVGTPACVWNGFFWNSNGNITFSTGDTSQFTDNTATVPEFRSGPPRIAPAWTDLNPNARAASLRNFPVMALGFANINAFKIRWINVPKFGNEGCTGSALSNGALIASGLANTFSITLYDDGTGIDENANQPLNPANPIGNNDVQFDLQEGPTDLLFTREPNTGAIVGCAPRPEGSGFIVFDYCRMDLLGTPDFPVITGYSIGGLNPLNPPGLCEINLSKSAAAADLNPFAVLPDSNNETANICANCCIGEGTEPTLFELFNEGSTASTGAGGEITFAKADFDLRFEGNDPLLCTSTRQKDLNRGRVCFFGIGCAPPANPKCLAVIPSPFAATPTTTGLVNALCNVQLNAVGCGFFPNEVTTVCQGFEAETGVPLQRPGKTVSTAEALACDTNGDSIPEAVIPLTAVTPVSCNLVRGTLATLAALPGTAFPPACCGGPATITLTTSFTEGDNNAFGAFTRTAVCSLNLGVRAPVVFSVTPSNGDCRTTDQDLIITGACFEFTTPNPLFGQPGQPQTIVGTVTSVFAQDVSNPANIIQAKTFVVVNPGVIDAHFSFGSANNGKTFLIFVVGTGGTSRNLTTAPAGTPAGCPLGNEQGIQVKFKCDTPGTPGTGQTPDLAVVTKCQLVRDDAGIFSLDVFGSNIKNNAAVTVGGQTPKKVKFVDLDPTSQTFTKISIKKKVCKLLTGSAAIVITNPGQTQGSVPFNCQERCPTN